MLLPRSTLRTTAGLTSHTGFPSQVPHDVMPVHARSLWLYSFSLSSLTLGPRRAGGPSTSRSTPPTNLSPPLLEKFRIEAEVSTLAPLPNHDRSPGELGGCHPGQAPDFANRHAKYACRIRRAQPSTRSSRIAAGLQPMLEGGDDITPSVKIVVDEPTCGGDRESNPVPCPRTDCWQQFDHLVKRQQFTTAERRSSQHSMNSTALPPMVVSESN